MPRRNRRQSAPPSKHAFWEDAEIPADFAGRRRCRRCGVMGKPGDQRHSDEFPETPLEDASSRILGENE